MKVFVLNYRLSPVHGHPDSAGRYSAHGQVYVAAEALAQPELEDQAESWLRRHGWQLEAAEPAREKTQAQAQADPMHWLCYQTALRFGVAMEGATANTP